MRAQDPLVSGLGFRFRLVWFRVSRSFGAPSVADLGHAVPRSEGCKGSPLWHLFQHQLQDDGRNPNDDGGDVVRVGDSGGNCDDDDDDDDGDDYDDDVDDVDDDDDDDGDDDGDDDDDDVAYMLMTNINQHLPSQQGSFWSGSCHRGPNYQESL